MRISVLIPTHNYAAYVPEAVRSALEQRGGAPECIVVDDGSTDGTEEALKPFAGCIQFVRQENRGMAAALNEAYRRSTGDVICLLDADDTWREDKLERVRAEFERDPELGMVHHWVQMVDASGAPVPNTITAGTASGRLGRVMRRKVLRWMFNPTSTLCLRRSVCELVFPLVTDLRGNGDDLIAATAALLAPVGCIPEPLSYYRMHGNNLWVSGRRDGAEDGASPSEAPAFEDVDREEAPRRYVRLLEIMVRQANTSLERAGLPGGLSPWLKWNYLKYRAELEGVSPLEYLPKVFLALRRIGGLGAVDRIGLGLELTRRAWKYRKISAPGGAARC